VSDSSGCECPPGFHRYGVHAPGHAPADVERRLPRGPGLYPVEDVATLSSAEAIALLEHANLEAELGAVRCPHIVITRDVETGAVTYTGPLPTGLEALTVAHEFVEQHRAVDPRWTFTLTVAPLFPH
jgi:hypothetical protein